jgi:hypothetical protein
LREAHLIAIKEIERLNQRIAELKVCAAAKTVLTEGPAKSPLISKRLRSR